MPIQLVKLALKDGSANEVIASVVQEGGEGATRQVFSSESVDAIIEDGQLLRDVHDFTLSLAGLYSSAQKSQLESWVASAEDLTISGYTVDGQILQGTGKLNYKRGFAETYQTSIFEMTRRGQYGYDSVGYTNAGMILSLNGLALYGFVEGATSGVAAGWTYTGSGEAFTAGAQEVADSEYIERSIYFPFEDVTVYGSINCVDVSGTAVLSITAKNSAGSAIGSATTTTFTTTGNKEVSKLGPAGVKTYTIKLEADNGGSDYVDFNAPMFSLKPRATLTYTEF